MFIDKENLDSWASQPLSNNIINKISYCTKHGIKPQLLLFDLDGTLHAHGKIPQSYLYTHVYPLRNSQGRITRQAAVRHHTAESLARLASHESIIVGFYTSCMSFTADQVVSDTGIFKGSTFDSDLYFPFFSRDFCKKDLAPDAKPHDTLRDLDGVIEAANLRCAYNGLPVNTFSKENVFLIDNEIRKVNEFTGNYIIVPTFESHHAAILDDRTLTELANRIISAVTNEKSIGDITLPDDLVDLQEIPESEVVDVE